MSALRRMGVLLLTAVVVSSCGLGSPAESVTPSTLPPESTMLVTLGGVETAEGDPSRRRLSWSRLLFRDHLPAQTVFVDLAVPGATAADGVETQLSSALSLAPTLATIWFDDADFALGTSVADYQRSLDTLVFSLTAEGVTVVVITGASSAGQVHEAAADAVAEARGALRVRGADPDDAAQLATTISGLL